MTPGWFQLATYGLLAGLLAVDLLHVARRPHVPSLAECARWVAFYVALAIAFCIAMFMIAGAEPAGQFAAGWLTEYSLSIDNLFVFMIIMTRFDVPREYQQKVLFIGIMLSLALRGGFILIGAEVLDRFSWFFYLFGLFLLYGAVTISRESPEYRENALIRYARRVLRADPGYAGGSLFTGGPNPRSDGAVVDDRTSRSAPAGGSRRPSMMVIVLIALGTTDLLFALDSIPAIFGLTTDPFVVFTATLFALMGLRQLFFLIGGLLDRLTYLTEGLGVVLGFIGVKLILESLHANEVPFINGGQPVSWAPELPTWLSLAVIVGVLGGAALLGAVRKAPSHKLK